MACGASFCLCIDTVLNKKGQSMTLTQLAQKHNLEPESAKAFLREWIELTTEYCEQCHQPASAYIIYTNVSDAKHPICDCCARQHEQTAQEINQHEMDNFGGAYGLVTFAYEPLIARPNMEDL